MGVLGLRGGVGVSDERTAAQTHGKGAWYFISRWYCVLCGHSQETRERRYDEKPSDPAERQEYTEGACGVHFC